MAATVGLGLVGNGFAARFHVENYLRVHGVDVRFVGVYSRRPEATSEFAKEYKFEKTYGSLEEMLADPDVDMVDTCVPNVFHEEMAVQVLQAGKHVVVEKPFAGSFTPGKDPEDWQRCLDEALASADRMIEAERVSGKLIMYAENLVYAPGVQKASRLLASAKTSILRMVGEESHSGTHSPYAMKWETSGGGSLYNKGCHSLGAMLFLKYEEGLRRLGKRIRPSWVVGTVANLTHSEAFLSESPKNIRTGWSVAQISAADIVLGGIQNILSVYAGRAAIHIGNNPNNAMLTYAPDGDAFASEYIREKVETKAGWQFTNPDEDWINGFPHETQDFCEVATTTGREPISGSFLGRDVVAVCYGAYLSAATGRRIDVPTG